MQNNELTTIDIAEAIAALIEERVEEYQNLGDKVYARIWCAEKEKCCAICYEPFENRITDLSDSNNFLAYAYVSFLLHLGMLRFDPQAGFSLEHMPRTHLKTIDQNTALKELKERVEKSWWNWNFLEQEINYILQQVQEINPELIKKEE